MGFGEAAFDTTSLALMLTLFSDRTATAWSLVQLASGLGFITGAPLGGLLYDIEGFFFPFLITGSMLLILIPAMLWLLSNIQLHTQIQESETEASMWQLARKPLVLIVCLSVVLANASLSFIEATLAVYLDHTFGWSATHIGLVFLIAGAAYVVTSLVIGPLVDATKPRRVMILGLLMEGCGMMMIGPSFVFQSLSPKSWLVYVAMALFGCSICVTMTSAAAEIVRFAVSRGYERGMTLNGLVSGLVMTFNFLAGIFGAPVGGALTSAFGFRHSSSFFAVSIFLAIGVGYCS